MILHDFSVFYRFVVTFRNRRFPVELLTNSAPKFLGVVNALVVHLVVLLHALTMGLALNPLRRLVDVGHDSEIFYSFKLLIL